ARAPPPRARAVPRAPPPPRAGGAARLLDGGEPLGDRAVVEAERALVAGGRADRRDEGDREVLVAAVGAHQLVRRVGLEDLEAAGVVGADARLELVALERAH